MKRKDQEIEQLQKRVLEFVELNMANRKLINELADVLELYWPTYPGARIAQLIDRAREAAGGLPALTPKKKIR